MTLRLLATLLILATPSSLPGQEEATDVRIVSLGKVWSHIKYHHPFLAYRADIDWDAALVRAIPQVRNARSPTEYRSAVSRMLSVLADPLTRVIEPGDPPHDPPQSEERGLTFRVTPDSLLLVTVRNYYALNDASSQAALDSTRARIASARRVVFDLRSNQPVDPFGEYQLEAALAPLEQRIASQGFIPPGERRRVFYGYQGSSAFSSGQYRSGFFTRFPSRTRPATGARDVPAVFILNGQAPPPRSALALQAAGTGLVVFHGSPGARASGGIARLAPDDDLTVHVRESEPVHPDGTAAELLPDLVVPGAWLPGRDPALDSALSLARRFRPSTNRRRVVPAVADAPLERSYAAMEYPSLEYRMLALFRFWSAIHYFYPYRHLLEQSWDSILPEFLPRFMAAESAIEYNRTIAEMATRLHDSHAYVAGSVYNRSIIGEGYPPIRVRIIDGLPVVVAWTDSTAVTAGISPGDVVLAVDGENALARLARYQHLISASTVQSSRDKAALTFMNGSVGSRVRLRVQDRAGNEKEVSLPRRREDYTTLYHRERHGDVIRMLPGNIGYADLDRLPFDMVDSMFQQLRHASAIIFDMRGYPNGTFWAIAPRLTSREPVAALLETPLVGHDSPAPASESFYQRIAPSPFPDSVYTGKTIMLIDERAQSQAEHTGLFLRAANGTRFVGSPTAGANGEVTTLTLPGGVTVGFTGQSVRHPDGSQLQRIGLIPDLVVYPTLQGIRAGHDEILEAAIRLLSLPTDGTPDH